MKGRNYREPKGQPYTRVEYIHGPPTPKISKFIMGDPKGTYEYKVTLISQSQVQIRHNALEAARIAANKVLTEALGESGYLLHIRVYPHIVLRENKMIATAGADRLQEGMRRAFGKPIGRAARVKNNQELIDVYIGADNVKIAQKALEECSKKLPMPCRIVVEKIAEAPKAVET
ncbi:MAG: 50S ribosomal protein L16 [Candidatus Bathyarchaeia archaeon]|nr:50S ribosomal protein L16 [Candidatus Bathyarchaeota archaeon]